MASATRSVAAGWSGEVMTHRPPADSTTDAISLSHVATTTSENARHRSARRLTCSTMGRPRTRTRGLPGNRLEAMRAGITAATRTLGVAMLLRQRPAIHVHALPGDSRSGRAGQKVDRLCHFLRGWKTAQRRLGRGELLQIAADVPPAGRRGRLVQRCKDLVRRDVHRADGVDPDPAGPQLLGQRLGDAVDRKLARAVGAVVGAAALAGQA